MTGFLPFSLDLSILHASTYTAFFFVGSLPGAPVGSELPFNVTWGTRFSDNWAGSDKHPHARLTHMEKLYIYSKHSRFVQYLLCQKQREGGGERGVTERKR